MMVLTCLNDHMIKFRKEGGVRVSNPLNYLLVAYYMVTPLVYENGF